MNTQIPSTGKTKGKFKINPFFLFQVSFQSKGDRSLLVNDIPRAVGEIRTNPTSVSSYPRKRRMLS